MKMIVDQERMHCFDLVAKDLCEAHAADRTDIMMREDRLADFDRSEARFGLWFIAGSLAVRMALAVNRTLQGASNDEASFARLLKLAKASRYDTDLSGFEERLNELRKAATARKLQKCKNGFMAHTLAGELGSRGGMKSKLVTDLLYELTSLYEDIHRAVVGTEDRAISEALEKWRVRAEQAWDALVGIEKAEEGEFA
jgi:hypothetical protein